MTGCPMFGGRTLEYSRKGTEGTASRGGGRPRRLKALRAEAFSVEVTCMETGRSYWGLHDPGAFISCWSTERLQGLPWNDKEYHCLARCYGCNKILGVAEKPTYMLCEWCREQDMVVRRTGLGRKPRLLPLSPPGLTYSLNGFRSGPGFWCTDHPGLFWELPRMNPACSLYLLKCFHCDRHCGLVENSVMAMCSDCLEPYRPASKIVSLNSRTSEAMDICCLTSEVLPV